MIGSWWSAAVAWLRGASAGASAVVGRWWSAVADWLRNASPGLVLAAGAAIVALLLWASSLAHASAVQAAQSAARTVAIPQLAAGYRLAVERAAGEYFGLAASPARLAAQLHQESGWRHAAQSAYAQGLAQFTAPTARWLPAVCPELGEIDPWDAQQSIRAAACYDRWLHQRLRPLSGDDLTECARWMFALRGYNGGPGWIDRERRAVLGNGGNPDDWRTVAQHRLRSAAAHAENTRYPLRILITLEPAYIAAGWDGTAVCAS